MRKSTLRSLIAILVVAVLAVGVCIVGFVSRNDGGKWFKNGNISTWHWSDKLQTGNENGGNGEDKDPVGSGELVNGIESNGIKLLSAQISPDDYAEYGIDSRAETAYTIKASVNDDAVDKSVLGGISWKNSSSSWANGKNLYDYVTFNQTVEYGLDFTITVKQSFGEPVIFRVSSVMDSGVNAVCQIDYLKEMLSVRVDFNPSLSSQGSGRLYVGNTMNNVQIVPEYGVGTVTGNISKLTARLSLNQYTMDNLKSRLNQNSLTNSYSVKSELVFSGSQDGFKIPLDATTFLTGSGNASYANTIINNFIYDKGWTSSSGSAAVLAGIAYTRCIVTYTYGSDYSVSKTYIDENVYNFRKDGVSAIKTITDIDVDKDHIVALPN